MEAIPISPGSFMEDLTSSRSVRRAGLLAGIAGLVGMIILCYVFLDADFIVGLAGFHKVIGWILALLLLLAVGGYALLAFYGFRLRSAWGKRRQLSDRLRQQSVGRLAMSDLRKIRWYSAATMLTILVVYLTPSEQPSFAEFWRSYDYRESWLKSPTALRCGVLLWTAVAAAVVLAARRAAWDLAAAAGDLSGPDDVRAFEVLAPGALQAARGADVPAAPLMAIPLSQDEWQVVGEVVASGQPIPPQPLSAMELTPTPVVAAAKPSALERLAAAESIGSRRDWETVLLTLMVLLLLVAVKVVDGSREIREDLYDAKALSDTYERFSTNTGIRLSALRPPTQTEPDAVAGTMAVAAHAGELLITILSMSGILWVSICLMSGPRWRRPVLLLLVLVTALLLYYRFAASYFGHHSPNFIGRYPEGWGHGAIPLEAGIVPLMLIVVLTRPPVRSLFDLRVRKRRQRGNEPRP